MRARTHTDKHTLRGGVRGKSPNFINTALDPVTPRGPGQCTCPAPACKLRQGHTHTHTQVQFGPELSAHIANQLKVSRCIPNDVMCGYKELEKQNKPNAPDRQTLETASDPRTAEEGTAEWSTVRQRPRRRDDVRPLTPLPRSASEECSSSVALWWPPDGSSLSTEDNRGRRRKKKRGT